MRVVMSVRVVTSAVSRSGRQIVIKVVLRKAENPKLKGGPKKLIFVSDSGHADKRGNHYILGPVRLTPTITLRKVDDHYCIVAHT